MNRQCGECTLCCKLLPVPPIHKPAGKRCQYQRHGKGCTIYARRPSACEMWSCQWVLGGTGTERLSRPDRVHYLIDPVADYIRMTYDDKSDKPLELPVIQIWLDAGFPDAHRDPALRAYLESEAERTGMAALVRPAGNVGALGLFAPAISEDKQWHEVTTNFHPEDQHSAADIARVMEAQGLRTVIETTDD